MTISKTICYVQWEYGWQIYSTNTSICIRDGIYLRYKITRKKYKNVVFVTDDKNSMNIFSLHTIYSRWKKKCTSNNKYFDVHFIFEIRIKVFHLECYFIDKRERERDEKNVYICLTFSSCMISGDEGILKIWIKFEKYFLSFTVKWFHCYNIEAG